MGVFFGPKKIAIKIAIGPRISFVALSDMVILVPSDRFFDFLFPSYGCRVAELSARAKIAKKDLLFSRKMRRVCT